MVTHADQKWLLNRLNSASGATALGSLMAFDTKLNHLLQRLIRSSRRAAAMIAATQYLALVNEE